jgi:hypothetical protein
MTCPDGHLTTRCRETFSRRGGRGKLAGLSGIVVILLGCEVVEVREKYQRMRNKDNVQRTRKGVNIIKLKVV